jgi:hypothetical protein
MLHPNDLQNRLPQQRLHHLPNLPRERALLLLLFVRINLALERLISRAPKHLCHRRLRERRQQRHLWVPCRERPDEHRRAPRQLGVLTRGELLGHVLQGSLVLLQKRAQVNVRHSSSIPYCFRASFDVHVDSQPYAGPEARAAFECAPRELALLCHAP